MYQIDIEKILNDVKEIIVWNDAGQSVTQIKEKYSEFVSVYPVIFKNIIEKKMAYEEVEVALKAFERAQSSLFNNINTQQK